MYEQYYGFSEKPFSLTPDPKFLYRSESHANAFELLQYAIARREGFVVVTGDIGTGKTTICRALLEQIDRKTFTALVLNPFLSEEDLLKRILQDFGVMSRDEVKAGRLAGITKQELIDTLYDFLLGLIPLKANAVLIIDEAQNLPLQVLEQIRILSNLETDKEKLLQIILVGQLNLQTLLRSPELKQLDQRVSIRYELKPLDEETVAAYVAHRLTIAGGSASVQFTAKALEEVYRQSSGIPRIINLICDRALLAGFSMKANRITPEMVQHAATSLDLAPRVSPRFAWLKRRASLAAAAAVVLLASACAVGATAWIYQHFAVDTLQASSRPAAADVVLPAADRTDEQLPIDAAATVLAASYPAGSDAQIRSLSRWLEAAGYRVYSAQVDLGPAGRWQRVLAGTYTDEDAAAVEARRINQSLPGLEAQGVTAAIATGTNR
jgi:type II secretory pathway predicted ATPase ExeA